MKSRDDIALAFDLDDTLYDERSYVCACVRHVAEALAPQLQTSAQELEAAMLSATNPYDGLRDACGACAPTLDTFLSLYRSTKPSTLPLRPDARRLLDTLATCRPEIPLYIITDGRLEGQMAKIAALGLERRIDRRHIIISEAIGYDKHSAMPFVTAMARESRDRGWVYIGDNVSKDFYWPRRLGWHTIMVADAGCNIHPQPRSLDDIEAAYRPDRTIQTLDYITQQICQQHS